MGTWGTGNFDDDTSSDHLSILTDQLIREVADAMAGDPVKLEPDEYWGVAVPCNLELLLLIAEQRYVGTTLPEADTIAGWKQQYLTIWDRAIYALEPGPEFKVQRRAVLVRTFDQLAALAQGLS